MKLVSKVMLAAVLAASVTMSALAQESSDVGKWYISPGVGVLVFEGNEPANPGAIGLLRVGYDINDHWSVELGGIYGPRFKANSDNTKYAPPKFKTAWAWGVTADALYHFRPMERLDPYLSVGWMYMHSADEIFADSRHLWCAPRLGGGLIWNWTDDISLRANANVAFGVPSGRIEFYPSVDIGMIYRFGGGSDANSSGSAVVTPVAATTAAVTGRRIGGLGGVSPAVAAVN